MGNKKAHWKTLVFQWARFDTRSAEADPSSIRYLLLCSRIRKNSDLSVMRPNSCESDYNLFNHSLNRDADVLDVAVLHAQRESCLSVKTALRRLGEQFRQGGFYLLNLVRLRRGLYSCLNHGVTIATSENSSTRIFGHLSFCSDIGFLAADLCV